MSGQDKRTLEDIWSEDKLGRLESARFLQTYLTKKHSASFNHLDRSSLVVNLKGSWGSGKSFFLNRFAEQLRGDGHLVAEIDAWKADPEIDPLVSLIAGIQAEVDRNFEIRQLTQKLLDSVKAKAGKFLVTAGKGAARSALRKVFGSAAEEMEEIIVSRLPEVQFGEEGGDKERSNDQENSSSRVIETSIDAALNASAVGNFFSEEVALSNARRHAIEEFSHSMAQLANSFEDSAEYNGPIFVLIDELDRCNPKQAILFLERVNHLFDSSGVVFVIGSDSDQLLHSIKAVYGTDFDARTYLERFFNFTYNLTNDDTESLCRSCLAAIDFDENRFGGYCLFDKTYEESLISMVSAAEVTTRETKQFFFLLSVFLDLWYYEDVKIDLTWMVAAIFMVQLQQGADIFQTNRRTRDQYVFRKLEGFLELELKIEVSRFQTKNLKIKEYLNECACLAGSTSKEAYEILKRADTSPEIYFLSMTDVTLPNRPPGCQGKYILNDYLHVLKQAQHIEAEI